MPTVSPTAAPLRLVPFREVRHDQPDDCLHYESVAVRGQEMDWKIPPHRHEGLSQFQYLESGHVQGTIDGKTFAAPAPALLWLAPGSVHGFIYDRDTIGHQITVPTEALRQMLGHTRLLDLALDQSFVLTAPDADTLADCRSVCDRLAREFRERRPGRVQALLACTALLVVQFWRGHGEHFARQRAHGMRDTLVQRYLALLEQHYRLPHPLGFYAERLNVTPDHLSRACRALLKQPALALLNERRMLEARRLLAYSALSVSAIAGELGYDDPAYFSKVFHRRVGSTPSRYRSQVAGGIRR